MARRRLCSANRHALTAALVVVIVTSTALSAQGIMRAASDVVRPGGADNNCDILYMEVLDACKTGCTDDQANCQKVGSLADCVAEHNRDCLGDGIGAIDMRDLGKMTSGAVESLGLPVSAHCRSFWKYLFALKQRLHVHSLDTILPYHMSAHARPKRVTVSELAEMRNKMHYVKCEGGRVMYLDPDKNRECSALEKKGVKQPDKDIAMGEQVCELRRLYWRTIPGDDPSKCRLRLQENYGTAGGDKHRISWDYDTSIAVFAIAVDMIAGALRSMLETVPAALQKSIEIGAEGHPTTDALHHYVCFFGDSLAPTIENDLGFGDYGVSKATEKVRQLTTDFFLGANFPDMTSAEKIQKFLKNATDSKSERLAENVALRHIDQPLPGLQGAAGSIASANQNFTTPNISVSPGLFGFFLAPDFLKQWVEISALHRLTEAFKTGPGKPDADIDLVVDSLVDRAHLQAMNAMKRLGALQKWNINAEEESAAQIESKISDVLQKNWHTGLTTQKNSSGDIEEIANKSTVQKSPHEMASEIVGGFSPGKEKFGIKRRIYEKAFTAKAAEFADYGGVGNDDQKQPLARTVLGKICINQIEKIYRICKPVGGGQISTEDEGSIQAQINTIHLEIRKQIIERNILDLKINCTATAAESNGKEAEGTALQKLEDDLQEIKNSVREAFPEKCGEFAEAGVASARLQNISAAIENIKAALALKSQGGAAETINKISNIITQGFDEATSVKVQIAMHGEGQPSKVCFDPIREVLDREENPQIRANQSQTQKTIETIRDVIRSYGASTKIFEIIKGTISEAVLNREGERGVVLRQWQKKLFGKAA